MELSEVEQANGRWSHDVMRDEEINEVVGSGVIKWREAERCGMTGGGIMLSDRSGVRNYMK